MRLEGLLLKDIYEASHALAIFTDGISKEEFLSNDLIQTAAFGKLIIMGEAAGQLSQKLRVKYSYIPWSKIIKNRNFMAHVYFGIDWETAWDTVTQHAIPL